MIDYKKLSYWLGTSTDDLFAALPTTGRGGERYAYIDNGADVLAVAHLDTVQPLSGITSIDGDVVHATGLDDRLGAYAITHVLPFKVDLLYTDLEEIGQSTAQYFTPTKTYRYILEVDRGGVDAVTYGRDNSEFLADMVGAGYDIGRGSFTDLCYLDSPACMINAAAGYYNAHGKDSFFSIRDFCDSMKKLARFNAYGRAYAADTTRKPERSWTYDTATDWGEAWEMAYFCCLCGVREDLPMESPICEACDEMGGAL